MTALSIARRRAAIAAATLGLFACGAALSSAQAQGAVAPAAAASESLKPGFTPVGDFGAYRLDAVRDGMHEGARVRFVDMTLHNRSAETTFPETIQAIWWQGRNNGDKVEARFRDLRRFGMYDFIKPGQVIEVTYIMPVRTDIDGIRADYMKAPKGHQERRWTWDELSARAPGRLYHRGRPVSSVEAAVPVPAATAPAHRAPAASSNGRTSLPTKKGLKRTLGSKLKSLPFRHQNNK